MQRVLKLINAMIYALGSIDTYDQGNYHEITLKPFSRGFHLIT